MSLADYPNPDVRHLWRAVCAQPDEDTPRLALADCLEENGDPDRAEFIRVQVQLAPLAAEGHGSGADRQCPVIDHLRKNMRAGAQVMPKCRTCDRAFELECDCARLLRAHEAAWRRAGKCPACGGDSGLHMRVMNTDTRTVRTHRITVCPACHGTGDRGGLLAMTVPENTGDPAVTSSEHRVDWQRGFPCAVHAPLSDVFVRVGWAHNATSWVPTPRALAWVREWGTATRIVLTDRRPYHNAAGAWIWITESNATNEMRTATLPKAVYAALADDIDIMHRGFAKAYLTEAEAVDALALAVARVLRAALTG